MQLFHKYSNFYTYSITIFGTFLSAIVDQEKISRQQWKFLGDKVQDYELKIKDMQQQIEDNDQINEKKDAEISKVNAEK